ncbi:MAG: DUF302 domain-containing protein [Gammaproteobacteria bacterium]|nr:DUF302 domain-containing protein [Gammaproteobacteria bacterium]
MYEFHVTLPMAFDTAIEHLRDVLMSEHLGIVSDVDVQAIFKNKMGKEIPAYRILGACNPKLADRVISDQPNAGVLLPCNVVVRQTGAKTTEVALLEPGAVLGLTQSAEAMAVAEEAKAMLMRVVDKLSR